MVQMGTLRQQSATGIIVSAFDNAIGISAINKSLIKQNTTNKGGKYADSTGRTRSIGRADATNTETQNGRQWQRAGNTSWFEQHGGSNTTDNA